MIVLFINYYDLCHRNAVLLTVKQLPPTLYTSSQIVVMKFGIHIGPIAKHLCLFFYFCQGVFLKFSRTVVKEIHV